MTCPDCTKASSDLWHGYSAHCQGCAARAVSRGPSYHEAIQAGRQLKAYRDELQSMGVTHEEVKAAARADALRRSNA